jgi:hypothetical protein
MRNFRSDKKLLFAIANSSDADAGIYRGSYDLTVLLHLLVSESSVRARG